MNKINKVWWSGKPEIDQEIKEKFGETFKLAEADQLEEWKKESRGLLALIIVLDQFSRSIYRGKKEAFATDLKAAHISVQLQEHSDFSEFSKHEKIFALMPCMHAEDVELVGRCLEGFKLMETSVQFAQDHYDIVKEFGRYPHRNEILERESTEAEKAWIQMNNETQKYKFAIIAKK